ncbi:hypothetical protein AO715_10355 [Xanthomonas sp. Mitacek01]|nr:hypothetical protein AO715_10355 [Xanthomonas sp. Mitacek01]
MQMKGSAWFFVGIALLSTVALDASAQVYKCQSGGRNVYQDTPCEGAAVQTVPRAQQARSPSSGAPSSAQTITPAGDLADLYRQIRSVEEEDRRLDGQYRRDVASLRARAAHMPVADADREVRLLNTRHQQRMQGVHAQREALTAELRRRCPNGSSLNETRQTCN